jgi:flavin-dependent dehydrogenase
MIYDMIVLGAGLAGSSIAANLASRGWKVALLERQQMPHHKVCGEFLSPESQGSLRTIGLYDTVAALNPAVMDGARLFSRSGIALSVALPGPAWGVSRFALDAALAQAAAQAGADLRQGTTAVRVQQSAEGYEVSVRAANGAAMPLRSRAVVAAFGRHAPLSLRASDLKPDSRPTHVGVKCHYSGINQPPEVRLYLFDGGYVGVSPIENGNVNVCMLVTRAVFGQAGTVAAMIARAAELNPTFGRHLAQGQALPETEIAVAPVDTGRPATPWEQFARLGDAAAMIPPLCGDGMAMALRAAEVCAPLAHEFLSGVRTLASWEAAYRTAWHREFDDRLRLGRRLQRVLGMPGIGGALLGIGALLPPLSAQLVRATRGQVR